MTFVETETYLESLIPPPDLAKKKPGLARMQELVRRLDNPQLKYPTVHIGGTSGKTSTSMMIAKTLEKAGYKTGLHISPHLEDVRERMQINGQIPSDEVFIGLVEKVKVAAEAMRQTDLGAPSYFEFLLACMFLYFEQEQVDIAVIEVGMGGLYDGTNVVEPLVAILTNVGLDHTEYLGDTVEKIATEKVGIFKPGSVLISGVTQPSVITIAEEKAAEVGAKLKLLHKDFDYKVVDQTFFYQEHLQTVMSYPLARGATYQVSNMALAVPALRALNNKGFTLSDAVISHVLQNFQAPGRFEVFTLSLLATGYALCPIVLDGAHNPDKVQALVTTLQTQFPNKKITFIFGVKKDKNSQAMISLLEPLAQKFYFTQFSKMVDLGKDLAVHAENLTHLTNIPSEVIANPKEALAAALRDASKDDVICVTGSLYLVGEVRPLIKQAPPAATYIGP